MARKTEMLKGNGDTILDKLKKRIGETGEVLDYGLAWMERQTAETADMDMPILSKAADAIVNPALVGARAALANVTSGGGKYYQPEVRDEKHFSKAALRELGETVKSMRGRTWGRADGIDNAAQFNLTQTIGGFSMKNGAVTDKFDINKHYHGVPDALTSVARTVLGREEDHDAGKVKTHIPLAALGLQQAAKGGNTPGESKSSVVPKGHNPALDGYSGPRVVINPTTFKNEKDGLCVAFNEAFRILMEVNSFDPVAEPTEKQREFFSDTAYADDELQMRRTILARICTFDTSVTDPTDEQLQEAVEFLDTVLEIGAPQNQWEQRAVERIRTAIERSIGQPRTEEENPKPPAEGPAVAAAGGGETEEEALTRLAAGDTGKTLQEDTSTIEEREEFLEERGMDKSLAETGSMDTLIKMHEQRNGVPPADATQTRPDAPATDAKTDGKSALTNADVLASKDAVEFVAANGGGTTGNGISVDAGAKVMDDGRIVGADGNARNADGKIDNFGRNGEMLAEMQQQANPVQEQHKQNHPQTASERIGTTSGIKGLGGRELTAGEAAWQARKQASTAAWMQRTGRSSDGVADALAQRDERANNLRRNSQVDSGRRDLLGRKLDDRGRVIV